MRCQCMQGHFICRLVFSQSLLSLDLIEDFLCHWHDQIMDKAAAENGGEVSRVVVR